MEIGAIEAIGREVDKEEISEEEGIRIREVDMRDKTEEKEGTIEIIDNRYKKDNPEKIGKSSRRPNQYKQLKRNID